MGAMNMREALARARRLGCRVAQMNRTGEWKIVHAFDPSQIAICSNHRKDAPRHLLVMLKDVERSVPRADSVNVTEVSPRGTRERLIGKTIDPAHAAKHMELVFGSDKKSTPAPAEPPTAKGPVTQEGITTMEMTPKQRRTYAYKPELDAFLIDFVSRYGMRRGITGRAFSTVQESRPELLLDANGKVIPEATFGQHITALMSKQVKIATNAASGGGQEQVAALTAKADRLQKDYDAAGEIVRSTIDAANIGAKVLALVAELMRRGDAATLQTLLDLAKS